MAPSAIGAVVKVYKNLPTKLFHTSNLLLALTSPVIFYAAWYATHRRKRTASVMIVSFSSGLFSYLTNRAARKKT